MKKKMKLALALSLSLSLFSVAHADDLSDVQARNTVTKIKTTYGAVPAFIPQTLLQVPFYAATPEFLSQYGSSVGIYFRKSVYLLNSLFKPDGLDVEGNSPISVIYHEGWHAYYDLLLPRAQRNQLEAQWIAYYGRSGSSRDDSICYGDESIGNYLADVAFSYAGAVSQYKRLHTIKDGMIKLYEKSYVGADMTAYCGDQTAPYPISEYEKNFAKEAAGDYFPKPADLKATIEARFPQ